jgi:hypothetical protein
VENWRAAAKIDTGPLFRVMNRHGKVVDKRLSGEAVAMVVKRYVWQIGHKTHFALQWWNFALISAEGLLSNRSPLWSKHQSFLLAHDGTGTSRIRFGVSTREE